MIRTIIIPNTSHCSIDLNFPKDYLGEEVEIIAFKKYEGYEEKEITQKKFLSYDIIKIDTSDFKFNREQANER